MTLVFVVRFCDFIGNGRYTALGFCGRGMTAVARGDET